MTIQDLEDVILQKISGHKAEIIRYYDNVSRVIRAAVSIQELDYVLDEIHTNHNFTDEFFDELTQQDIDALFEDVSRAVDYILEHIFEGTYEIPPVSRVYEIIKM